jgi:hypothetical protein
MYVQGDSVVVDGRKEGVVEGRKAGRIIIRLDSGSVRPPSSAHAPSAPTHRQPFPSKAA